MLILTRRIGESVVIGDDLYITVLGVKGNQVRLGFDAPEHVAIHREEIYQRIQQERHKDNRNNAVYINESALLRLDAQFKKRGVNETSH